MREQALKMITDYLESQGKLVYARNVESVGSELAAIRAQVESKDKALRRICEYGAAKIKGDYTQAQIAKDALAATGKEV